MKETTRIAALFSNLYNGHPWIDVSITGTLNQLTAQQAAARNIPQCNTIWEIVSHMISWRKNVLQRVNGKLIKSPSHNYFTTVTDTSGKAWEKTLKTFAKTQEEWLRFLDHFTSDAFKKIYPVNGLSFYEHIHGILQHDAYHLGQIVLLSKLV